MNAIYCKAMKISPKARKKRTQGEIINLISVDAYKFSEFAMFYSYIWSSPLQIILGFYLLYIQLGKRTFID